MDMTFAPDCKKCITHHHTTYTMSLAWLRRVVIPNWRQKYYPRSFSKVFVVMTDVSFFMDSFVALSLSGLVVKSRWPIFFRGITWCWSGSTKLGTRGTFGYRDSLFWESLSVSQGKSHRLENLGAVLFAKIKYKIYMAPVETEGKNFL